MTVLEEFLQEKYIENFENFTSDDNNKVAKLAVLYKEYFYDPQDDDFGTVNYVLDSEGHALYLINKSGLPEEIQESLNGGNCGNGKTGSERYIDYVNLQDVYGVTSNLKVYYSLGDGSFLGISSTSELDSDTTSRPVLDASSSLSNLIKGDGSALTVADTQSVKNLTIGKTSGVTSLSDLYVLGSLETLTLDEVTLNNLDGIQTATKLNYVYIKNCKINDGDDNTNKEYVSLANVKKLKYLYFYNFNDADLEKLCAGIKDATYTNLEYLAFVGNAGYICSTDNAIAGERVASSYITNLVPLSTLKSSCVGNVKYLSLQSNAISDTLDASNSSVYALENLTNFSDLYLLRVERNNLTTLKGLENKTELVYLYAGYNKLGIDEAYTPLTTVVDYDTGLTRVATDEDMGKSSSNSLYSLQFTTKLKYLYLEGNVNIKWVSYLANDSSIVYLYFGDGTSTTKHCVNMVDTEVASIRKVLKRCGSDKTCPSKYWLSLLDDTDMSLEVNLSNQSITKSQFESLGSYTNIKYLNLLNVKIYENYDEETDTYSGLVSSKNDINTLGKDVFKKITNLQYLNVSAKDGSSFTNFNDLTFLKGINESIASDDIMLVELAAFNTLISTKEATIEDEITTWSNYNNGLKLLQYKRTGAENYYYSNLNILLINEPHIVLNDINDIVKKLVGSDKVNYSYFYGSDFVGLYTNNANVLSSLSDCDGLTKVVLSCCGTSGASLNFSSQTGLTYFRATMCSIGIPITFPASLSDLNGHITAEGLVSIANVTNLTYCPYGTPKNVLVSVLSTLSEDANISYLELRSTAYKGEKDLSMFKDIYDKTGYKISINKIGFDRFGPNNDIKSLNGIEYIKDVNKLDFKWLSNLTDISALSSFSTSLTYLALPDFSISDARVISSLSVLTYLDLSNNCLAPYIEIPTTDESGKTTIIKWYTIEEICNRMILNTPSDGKKVTLKLSGNTSITDWSSYTNNATYWSSNSTYGS